MSESNLDRGLAEAFGASSKHSVLRAIERITGEAPRILLREADSRNGASPMIDASSIERRAIPQGRGSYQILGEIARGGMGVVMKGHDNDLGRDVALKVLHKELAKRPEVLQRFVEEAQIGGQLQHPGIVPVYELGLMADERPYFTMKLVKGRTLAALLAERKSPTIDRRKLLDVFESVCQTMAYAHSRGVMHRDLKPANVMVGAFGEVQVVDWGLAKVLRQGGTADEKRAKQTNISIIETVRSEPGSRGSHSLVGSVMGTPAYMSPEQARGEIEKLDERSDVFSLGAILCEILTGAPPYLGENDKTLVEAASAKLDDASKRLEGCEADPELVALCRECLAPAQSARPRSAEVLAQRIHEYSVSVEERARQSQVDAAEARVKAHEERRARKLTVGLAASVLVTVLVAGGGWAWMSSERTRRERDTETQVNAALNEATLKRGEGNWAEALAAVERAKGLADSGAADDGLRSRVAADFAAIETDSKTARASDELVRDNAALLAELADVRQPEGDTIYPTDWAKLDAEHRAIFARHGLDLDLSANNTAALLDARGIQVELAAALDEWAAVRSRAGDEPGAAHLVKLARRIDADEKRGRLRDALLASDVAALKAFAANEELAQLPATTLNLLGAALSRNGAPKEAAAVYRQAALQHPSDFMLAMNLARTLTVDQGRTTMYILSPRTEEATRYYSAARALRPASVEAAHELGRLFEYVLKDHARALELFRSAAALHPGDAHLRFHLASSLHDTGSLDASVAIYRESIALDPKYAVAYNALGIALYDKHDLDGAVDAYRKAIELDPKFFEAQNNLGTALRQKGDLEGAIEAYSKAMELAPKLAQPHVNLGNVLAEKGEVEAAIAAFRRAIEIDPKLFTGHYSLGICLLSKGDVDGAIASDRTAIDLDSNSALAQASLGNALYVKGDLDGAIAAYRKAVELDSKLASGFSNLGNALQAKGDLDGAIAAERTAIGIEPRLATAYYNLGYALQLKGDVDGALAAYRSAIENNPKYVLAYSALGLALQQKGDFAGALEAEQKAIKLDPKCAGVYVNLGSVLNDSLRHHVGAIAAFRKATELDPKLAIAQRNLGVALRDNGDIDGAIAAWRKASELDPSLPNLQYTLAVALQAQGDIDGAIAGYRRASQLEPARSEPSDALAWLLATRADTRRRDGPEAVRLAQRAVARSPENANSFNNLGAALCCTGEWRQAIEALTQSIRLNRAEDEFGQMLNAENRCFLATAHAHLDELDKARAELSLAKAWHESHPQDANAVETARFLEEARAAIEAGGKR